MSEQTIARDAWSSFGESFSRQHEGWLVTMEQGRNTVAELEPLQDVRIDDSTAQVRVGDKSYEIENLNAIRVVSSNDSGTAIERVELVGSDETLALRFRTAIAPELVDGAA